jgi:formamidopyrimidine-DNA glycosylase
MPELPEVEHATRLARRISAGRTITSVAVRHASQKRGLPARQARSLIGDRIVSVVRRGKSQWFRLASGRELRVHFRMTGDWLIPEPGPLPRTVRAVLTFDDGSRLALDDPRALSVISLCADPGSQADGLGRDALDPGLTPRVLAELLVRRRIPIKVALLDQAIVAGVGNIYASEALWRARIDPRTPANEIPVASLRKLLRAVVATLNAALQRQQRYYGRASGSESDRFDVYDREGEPCRRCRTPIRRIAQAGRSTYFCLRCQVPRTPRIGVILRKA